MTTRLRSADGYAVATAVILMSIMLTIGLAAFAFVDTETRSSARERAHEARLNLTEGVVAAEVFSMSREWPETAAKAFPASCTEASTERLCPTPAQLKANFAAVDFNLGTAWEVKVRDDVSDASGAPVPFYDDAQVVARPTWDANQNKEMWVRAQGRIDGRQRTVVARVKVEDRPLKPPTAPFVAGQFNTGNSGGSKVIVDTGGVYGVVRCDTSTGSGCVDYGAGQISPVNMVRSDLNVGDAIPEGMPESLKAMAKAAGTYHATCPSDPSGLVVWVESGDCNYGGNTVVNGTTKRGIFIINNGTLRIGGSLTWWGLIYALNPQGCGVTSTGCLNVSGYNDTVVSVTGTATVRGGIFVEGAGRLSLGNSGNSGGCANCLPTLIYDPTVAFNINAFGTAGIIQNTWRELLTPTAAAAAAPTP